MGVVIRKTARSAPVTLAFTNNASTSLITQGTALLWMNRMAMSPTMASSAVVFWPAEVSNSFPARTSAAKAAFLSGAGSGVVCGPAPQKPFLEAA